MGTRALFLRVLKIVKSYVLNIERVNNSGIVGDDHLHCVSLRTYLLWSGWLLRVVVICSPLFPTLLDPLILSSTW